MSRLRRGTTAAALVASLTLVSACAAEPPADSWVMTPISYDNRMDGDTGAPQYIDAAYPMALTGDTAGGFWGVSAGSFLHIDANGEAVRRFNLDPGAPNGAIAALSPTVLAMATGERTLTYPGSVTVFDTEAMTWEEVHRDERALGDIAARGDEIYVVAYVLGDPAFTVEKLSLASSVAPIQMGPVFAGHGPVAIAVDSEGVLYIATNRERIIVAPDGTVQDRQQVGSANPDVAVSEYGKVAWSGLEPATATVPSFVEGGSAQARDIIDAHTDCNPESPELAVTGLDYLTLGTPTDLVTLPFLCAPHSITWINDIELVASIGNEGGAPLVRLTPPERAGA